MSVTAVVLSRTEMSGGAFCGCAAIERGGSWEQVRVLSSVGTHLHPSLFGVAGESVRNLWRPGRIIRMPEPVRSNPRITHPEDRLVDLASIRFLGMANEPTIRRYTAAFTFETVQLLFPNVFRQDNDKAFAYGFVSHPRSVGYVPCEKLTVGDDEYAEVLVPGEGRLVCKVKSEIFLAKIRGSTMPSGSVCPASLVRLGLANQTDWEGRFDPPRCYVMLTGTVR
ncbi:MAG: hypothetical protein WCO25_01545 [Candidatus Uhrbacteria bacterium]